MKLDLYLISYTKINSKWIKDLNIRLKTLKLLEETGGKLHDIGFQNNFLDVMPKAQATKARLDQWGDIKLKNVCASKDTINKVKRQTLELEKIFTNHIADKGLISRMYEEIQQLNNRKPK